MPDPTVGRIVLYRVASFDMGAMLNGVREGDVLPAMIVRTWDNYSYVNLKVFTDGSVDYWATSRQLGDAPGQWSWPVLSTSAMIQSAQIPLERG